MGPNEYNDQDESFDDGYDDLDDAPYSEDDPPSSMGGF